MDLDLQLLDSARKNLLQNAGDLIKLAEHSFHCGSGGHAFALYARACDELTFVVLLIGARPDVAGGKKLRWTIAKNVVNPARADILFTNYLNDTQTDTQLGSALAPLGIMTGRNDIRWDAMHTSTLQQIGSVLPHTLYGNGGPYFIDTVNLRTLTEGRLAYLSVYDSDPSRKTDLDKCCAAGTLAHTYVFKALV